MRYLRMLSNSIVGGGLVACYVLTLFLLLNPDVPLNPMRIPRLAATVLLFYGAHAAVVFYVLIVVRQLVASEVFSPGWLSLGLLMWLATAAAGFASAAAWINLEGFGPSLGPDVGARLSVAAVSLAGCAAMLFGLAIYGFSPDVRKRAVVRVLFVALIAVSLALPLAARGPGMPRVDADRPQEVGPALGAPDSPARVVMILLDGGSLDFISPAAAEGRLPNLGRMLDSGAVMHLATLRPTQPLPVWTAVATGKLPFKTGIRSAATYRPHGGRHPIDLLPDFCFAHGLVHFGLLREQLHSAAEVRAQTVWSIVGRFGVNVGIVGWPLTHPAQPVYGYLVTDQFQHRADVSLGVEGAFVHPGEEFPVASAAAARPPTQVTPASLASPASRRADEDGVAAGGQPLAVDAEYQQIFAELQGRYDARLSAVRFQGLDVAGHYFLPEAGSRVFIDVPADERRRRGRVLEDAYAFVDAAVGQALESLNRDDLLLVVSAFGMESLSLGKQLLERGLGNRELTGTHERAPDGFLLAYGSAVAPGRLRRSSVLDITPTVLYYLGIPVGRDMDGYARTDMFSREFTAERPITFIPSHDR